ncbi:hypothetical protein AU375_04402 [Methylobacterium radiotolerans]|nr:hypothetical protein AU375_04402 [Methylobacterium radiotolerans]
MRYALAAVIIATSFSAQAAEQPTVAELMKAENVADANCRGSADPEATVTRMECDRRSRIYGRLSQLGYCYGHRGQVGGDYRWHRCDPRSNTVDDLAVSREP